MEVESYEHGVPSWVDHMSDDPAKAREFYAALFGWDVEEGPPEAGGYAMAQKAGRDVAGIGPKMGPGPTAWSTYVNVDSADDIVEKVSANGGTVLAPPMDVMEAGRLAVFADPAGAVFGVWQPGLHKGAGLVNEESTFGWSELITDDVEGSKAFYPAVFGWDPHTHDAGGGPAYTEWFVGGRTVGGMMAKPPTMPPGAPSFWGIYFVVPDTDAAMARVAELGGSVLMGPMDIPQGRIAVVSDPLGAVFNIIAMGASGPPPGE
jgi:predicted enzyme related to lactoylglutathione lyase